MMATTATAPIAFIDLAAQRERLGDRIDSAIKRVLDHGAFIMGPEVAELESALADYCGVKHSVTCASGTDALLMVLLARGIGPGDAVIVPSFTFAATAEVVALLGATPVFVDVEFDTANLAVNKLDAALQAARAAGVTPRAVIAVDLFGQPADYEEIEAFCAEHELFLVADAAQSFGASWRDRRVGSIGDVACTSFFPAKPLGCYGDGGAIFTDDDELATVLRSLRVHGQGSNKYDNVRVGINGRLDTIQAAVLLEKLAIFDDELRSRERVAARYRDGLKGVVDVLALRPDRTSAWAQFTITCDARDEVAATLQAAGVPTAIYYPVPLHWQPAYAGFPLASDGLPASEELAGHVLSLPMHPYLLEDVQDRVIQALAGALR
ncbi:MAG: DegT/DnrJ/EryC1/StrS family aminotransferase [Actinobacteria bacterium]|nr:DegT/DnrJ/EryC1/StrS family aminotransferase [Actinomycetota bacterium]